MRPLLRRLITIPLYLGLLLISVVTLPLTAPLCVVLDAVRGTPLALTRALLFFTWYLAFECSGIIASGALWVWQRIAKPPHEAWLHANFRLKCWWARKLVNGARHCFGLRFQVEGLDELRPGPYLLFMRHASVADTILPTALVSAKYGIDFRHVIKRELLWDPCLDLCGNRLPNYFVDRSGADSAREIAGIQRLAEDLGPRDGVAIFPEGTRFTEAKRTRILEKLEASGDRDLYERTRALTHVLPPRLGGPIGLLEAAEGVDALFCTHVGFDGIQSFRRFLGGGLVNRTVVLTFWSVPGADVPRDRDARIEWLFQQWQRVDDWIDQRAKAES
jgi:1-acyl-sn-glycerol-3-phosphate acyltransferase